MGVRMCMFGVCVVSAYAFMSAVGMYVCECVCAYFFACVRACVNLVSNVTQFFSKLAAAKKNNALS